MSKESPSKIAKNIRDQIQEDYDFLLEQSLELWWVDLLGEPENLDQEWVDFSKFRDQKTTSIKQEQQEKLDSFMQLCKDLGDKKAVHQFKEDKTLWLPQFKRVKKALSAEEKLLYAIFGRPEGEEEYLSFGQAKKRQNLAQKVWWYKNKLNPQDKDKELNEFTKVTDKYKNDLYNTQFAKITKKYVDDCGYQVVVKVLRAHEFGGEIYLLEDAPKECPWKHLAGLLPYQAIDKIFSCLDDKYIQNTVDELKQITYCLLCLHCDKEWYLLYVCESQIDNFNEELINCLCFIIGGSPLENIELPQNAIEGNWILPQLLQKFYNIHNGFGEFLVIDHKILWGVCILPAHRLDAIGRYLCETDEEVYSQHGYHINDLLEILPHGSGDADCFLRESKDDSDPKVVAYNHETQVIYEYNRTFNRYFEEAMEKFLGRGDWH